MRLLQTAKTLGVKVVIRELLRRYFGVAYKYNGVVVDSTYAFRLIRKLKSKGYSLYGDGATIVVETRHGELAVERSDMYLLEGILEDVEKLYGRVSGRVVVDFGSYIGLTVLYFLKRGVVKVYAFEPVEKHFRYLLANVGRNGFSDRVYAFNYGVWYRDCEINAMYAAAGTGLRAGGDVTLKLRKLEDVLNWIKEREGEVDWVKMDCEGCEYALLTTPCEAITTSPRWVVEIHGATPPVIYKMSECGYKYNHVVDIERHVAIYYFEQSAGNR